MKKKLTSKKKIKKKKRKNMEQGKVFQQKPSNA